MELLAFVSKILLDWRVEELKREHELLNGPTHYKQKWPMHSKHLIKVGFKMKWKGVELLTLASKAFMDTRFLELKNENERLKLERFWQTYGADKLSKQLSSFHSRMNLLVCGCVSCEEYERFEPTDDEGEAEWLATAYADERWEWCRYQQWFEEFLDDEEMDVGRGYHPMHFHIYGNKEWFWGYGSKFMNARSVADPELRKLEKIFDALYYMSKMK